MSWITSESVLCFNQTSVSQQGMFLQQGETQRLLSVKMTDNS